MRRQRGKRQRRRSRQARRRARCTGWGESCGCGSPFGSELVIPSVFGGWLKGKPTLGESRFFGVPSFYGKNTRLATPSVDSAESATAQPADEGPQLQELPDAFARFASAAIREQGAFSSLQPWGSHFEWPQEVITFEMWIQTGRVVVPRWFSESLDLWTVEPDVIFTDEGTFKIPPVS